MSYILDALKKAEAERRQETVPGLHTQPLPGPLATRPPAPWMRPAVWIGAAATGALVVGVTWWQPWRSTPPAVPPTSATTTATTVAQAPLPQAPLPSEAAPASPPPVTGPATTPQPSRPVPAATETEVPAPSRVAEAPPKPAKPKARPQPLAKAAAPEPGAIADAKPSAPAAPAAIDEPLIALRELPDHVQREIPALNIGGYIYAEKPAARSVLINKRLLREGDQIAPDLTLEKMTPSGMVLNYKGTRFRTSY